MQPRVYYRISAGNHKLISKIKPINLEDLYERTTENNSIRFTAKKIHLGSVDEDYKCLMSKVSDETRKIFESLSEFTDAMDAELIRQIDSEFTKRFSGRNLKDLKFKEFNTEFKLSSAYAHIPVETTKLRAELLFKFSKTFLECREWIQSSSQNGSKEGTLDNNLMKCKSLVLGSIKNQLLDNLINKIPTGNSPEVRVSRRKAMEFADEGKCDHKGERTIFGQIMQGIVALKNEFKNFRQNRTDERCWRVKFLGEGSIDAGGPFRDSLVNMARELETGVLPLLMQSPNNRAEVGTNRECFVLNPQATGPTHFEMLHFLGCIIGFAIMSKSPVPLNLAPTVWKQLLGESLTLSDLDGIDTLSAKTLRDLIEHSQTLDEQEFNAVSGQPCFITVLSDGTEVPICDDGYAKLLTKDNVAEYCKLVIQARERENKQQIQELRRGVKTVLGDLTVLCLMDWDQLEVRACGEKTLNIEKLKSITKYSSCHAGTPTVVRFWRVMEERFTEEERQAYLKFVWGRTRLPIELSNLSYKHEIRLMSRLSVTSLPLSHTCFFQLDLPVYSTDDIMYEKLKLAITLCGAVDTDNDNIQDDED